MRFGTEIIYIPRIQAAVERFGDRFLQRVYTTAEQRDCGYQGALSRPNINQLAGRWAAKAAVAKALGTKQGISYTDIEIRREPSGAPTVSFHRQAAKILAGECQLSLSHERDYAIATALIIGGNLE